MATETSKWIDLLKVIIPVLVGGAGAGVAVSKATEPAPEPSCHAEVAVLKTRVDNLSEMKTDVKDLKAEVKTLSQDVSKLLYFVESYKGRRK